MDPKRQDGRALPALCAVMDRLLADDGCPWDREQTLESLRPYVIEEAYEVADAIGRGNSDDLCEELGDLLLQGLDPLGGLRLPIGVVSTLDLQAAAVEVAVVGSLVSSTSTARSAALCPAASPSKTSTTFSQNRRSFVACSGVNAVPSAATTLRRPC